MRRLSTGWLPEWATSARAHDLSLPYGGGKHPGGNGNFGEQGNSRVRVFCVSRFRGNAHATRRNLSGGQQQQLAIARALVSNPKVLVLDEPTEGIQPSIIKDIARALNKLKADRKFALLVSEQVLGFAKEIADRFLIIERGHFVYEDSGTTWIPKAFTRI